MVVPKKQSEKDWESGKNNSQERKLMKLSEDEIKDIIKSADLTEKDEASLITRIQNLIKAKEEEKEEKAAEAEDKPKFIPFGIVDLDTISDKSNDGLGYILMAPDDSDFGEIPFKITEAIRIFNESKKGRKIPVKSVSEACAAIPSKIWKQVGLKIKTKESVYFQSVQNITIPQL